MRITVENKDTQTGEGEHGPWTKYAILDTEGNWYSTFNPAKTFGGMKWDEIQPNVLLDIESQKSKNGKYNNLVSAQKANGLSDEPEDLFEEEELGEPPVNDKAFPETNQTPPPPPPPNVNMADSTQEAMEQVGLIIAQMKLKPKPSPDVILRAVVDLAVRGETR